jgi:hypothetical protein
MDVIVPCHSRGLCRIAVFVLDSFPFGWKIGRALLAASTLRLGEWLFDSATRSVQI